LKLNGFAQLRGGYFLDLRAPRAARETARHEGVRDARRRLNRRATVDALLAARAEREAAAAAADAAQAERERIAASIAPVVLPPARSGLKGAAAIAQLADDFITITTTAEGADLHALERMGWRRAQIFEHTAAARTLAYSRQDGVPA
jgi:hypothetical protein